LSRTARGLTDSLEQVWRDRAEAAAKARFLEDYLDESLWSDHVKTLRLNPPWRRQVDKGYEGTAAGLDHLVARLVEGGRHPYGLTVAQALAMLDEPLTERDSFMKSDRVVTIAADVLDLRFPAPPQNAGVI
jgi:hypothetical protein